MYLNRCLDSQTQTSLTRQYLVTYHNKASLNKELRPLVGAQVESEKKHSREAHRNVEKEKKLRETFLYCATCKYKRRMTLCQSNLQYYYP